MSPSARLRSLWSRRRGTASSAAEAATRARRARDHLERRRARERQRRRRERQRADGGRPAPSPLRLAPPLAFGAALALGGLFATPLCDWLLLRSTPLERVAIQGAHRLTPRDIASSANLEAGRALGSIDPAALREAVAAEPWIESARTLRLPSGTLVIGVVEREAVARWQREARGEPWLIDARGQGFAGRLEPAGALPLVRGQDAGEDGLSAEAMDLLVEVTRHASLAADPEALTLELPGADPAATRPSDRNAGYVLQIGAEGPRALLGRNLLSQRVARLAALLESDEREIASARWIDLRYADRAVLRTEPVSG